jgi:hypothetical protein
MTEDVPRIVATPPGPKTREILARQERVLYPGLAHDLGPFVINRKAGWQVEDVDGNVYLDFISAMASVPFGARAPTSWAGDRGHPSLRQRGHALLLERVRAAAGEELLRVAPDGMTRGHRPERHGGGRDRDPVHAASDRPPIVIGFMGGYHVRPARPARSGRDIRFRSAIAR